MKTLIISIICLLSISSASAQSDTSLKNRLDIYMRLNRELKFDELMDYTHPKIFELAPKEKIAESLKGAFNNDDIEMTLDSISITEISPAFVFEKTNFTKIKYRMVAGLRFKDSTALSGKDEIEQMRKNLEFGFPEATVVYNEKTGWFKINSTTIMFGIKDPAAPWLFLGYEKGSPNLIKLYPEAVIKHFQL